MFLRRQTDVPFERDAASRLLPWIIAVMAYLAALAVVSATVVNSAVSRWSAGLSGTLTVQIPAAESGIKETAERVNRAVRILRDTPGVKKIVLLDQKRVTALLEPWLGPNVNANDLPLPQLIDVSIERLEPNDVLALQHRISSEIAGANVEDHQRWLNQILDLVRSVGLLTMAIVGLIVFAAVITVIFATRTSMKIHHQVTEVLHLIGARDSYIARQFARQALILGLEGGIIGTVLAGGTLWAIGHFAGQVQAFSLSTFALTPLQWSTLAITPFAAAGVAMLTARFTVMRVLSRLA